PSFTREDRDPLTSVAAVVVDKSPSQNFGKRNEEAAKAQEALVDGLKKIKGRWKSASSTPARPMAKPTAPNCSVRWPRHCRTCRSTASPARS
ncbi:hypothetical protein K7461_29820, partial [Pseudomonas fluorescens]|nr:hypothetical protein [Pseudomonas fluorescens]